MNSKPGIVLLVDNPQKSRAFYAKLPGFQVPADGEDDTTAEVVALDGTRYLLANRSTASTETLKQAYAMVYEPGQTLEFAVDDLETLRTQFGTQVDVQENRTPWGHPLLLARDDDGYVLQFASKVHRSQEKTFNLYQQGIDALKSALKDLTPDDLKLTGESPDWNIQQLVHHIFDGDAIWSMAIKAALGNPGCEYSHDWYVNDRMLSLNMDYAGRPINIIVDLFTLNRLHILQMIQLLPDALDRHVVFRKGEERPKKLTVEVLVRMRSIHTLEHIEDIHAILRKHNK